MKKSCDERKKLMADSFLAQTQGLAVQTDCAITHGDSGGPLVNAAGELVGLNQSISADLATASFHVHLDEIREFTATYGEEGLPLLPDPFCDGGINPTLEDIDLDGIPETLVTKGGAGILGGYDRIGILIDLDQDHFTRKKAPTEPFDAEIALLTIREAAYVWYDTDGDSRFDLLLTDKNNDGAPEHAYRIDAEGRIGQDPTQAYRLVKGGAALELDTKSIAGWPLRHKSVFKDKAMAAKWKVVAGKMFQSTSIEE